jgi:hypothetical protein
VRRKDGEVEEIQSVSYVVSLELAEEELEWGFRNCGIVGTLTGLGTARYFLFPHLSLSTLSK